MSDAARTARCCAFSVAASNCSARSASATFWNAVSTVLRYCAVGHVVGGLGRALLVQQRKAVEDRLRAARRRCSRSRRPA